MWRRSRASGWRGAAWLLLGCSAAPAPSAKPPVTVPAASPSASEPPPASLESLARAADRRGVALATAQLSSPDPAARLLAARALADYGAAAKDAGAALLAALSHERQGELAGTLGWALVELSADDAAEPVLRCLGDGSLALATHLDGSPAFELGRWQSYAGRYRAEPSLDQRYLNALGDGVGGSALLFELSALPADPEQAFARQKRIFDTLTRLGDPGAADGLLELARSKPHPYLETRAAQALAALGDLRAAPFLARRLRWDPLELYKDEPPWEARLKRDDNERVGSARLLADLATLHPEALTPLAQDSESALIYWLHQLPAPHANGMRALAAMQSDRDMAALRAWANPSAPLPRSGAPPPLPEEWVIAQSALRYVGRLRDAPSHDVLLKALQRRPHGVDVTLDALAQGKNVILGMSLRALGVGASDGLSEWGDPSAFPALLKYVEDPLNNELSREAAGQALAWVGRDAELLGLAQRLARAAPADAKDRHLEPCLLGALRPRPVPGVAAALLPLLGPNVDAELRHDAARAIGRNALDAAVQAKLLGLSSTPELHDDAALALMLGGSPENAVAALSSTLRTPGASLPTLLDLWYRSFEHWWQDDVEDGTLFRYVENARAMSSVALSDDRSRAPAKLLALKLAQIEFDDGPHSPTRPVLLYRLRRVAAGSDEKRAERALHTLGLLRAVGVLLHLSHGTAPSAGAARDVYLATVATPRPN